MALHDNVSHSNAVQLLAVLAVLGPHVGWKLVNAGRISSIALVGYFKQLRVKQKQQEPGPAAGPEATTRRELLVHL